MPKCDACRAEGATQRCTKCQGCWSCDRACAKRFWRTHKKFCTDDPVLKPHVPIELAVERALAKAPKIEAPPKATCYICLETEGPNGGIVMRGCACRGPSAGFAHVDCLAEMASRTPWIHLGGEKRRSRWASCPTCQSAYVGELALELRRCLWRLQRHNPPSDAKRCALMCMAVDLRLYDELDAADRLDEDSTRGLPPSNPAEHIQHDLLRANCHFELHRFDEALETLTRLRSIVERQTDDPALRSTHAKLTALTLSNLGRSHEALAFAVEAVERATEAAGPESQAALSSVHIHAHILVRLGQVGEAKAKLAKVYPTQSRVLGADHPDALDTKQALESIAAWEGRTKDGED